MSLLHYITCVTILLLIVAVVNAMALNSTDGPYTVYAPSDEAFSRLAPSFRQRLLDNVNRCATSKLS